jgi:hypothetical protein
MNIFLINKNYIYIILFIARSTFYKIMQTIILLKEKLIKENLELAVLNTHIKRRNNVIFIFYIYSLYFLYTFNNL